MDLEERFDHVESQLNQPQPPSWRSLGAALDLPDDRWLAHDPANAVEVVRTAWQRQAQDWTGVTALWLGIESDGTNSYLSPIGYGSLDDTGFPSDAKWYALDLESADLTAFAAYYAEDKDSNGYDYWAPLAWTGLTVRLLAPAPPNVTILAGFSGGDWLTFPPTT